MGRQRDSRGRFTSGGGGGAGGGAGGGGTQLGSAYGKVIIDASGVRSGVSAANSALGKLGGTLSGAVVKSTMAVAAAGVAVFGAFSAVAASGLKMSMALEAQMSGVKAVMQITDQQVQQLRDHVLELGVDPNLKVSAMQAAAAIEMLGRNGMNTRQILDGAARSTILLSNATNADFSQAADIATDVMALFNFQASEMETAVDGITSVVNNSKFSITDYQYALAQAGGIASTAGVSFDDLNTTIAAISPLFADGSSAGAGFKVMLQRMANPTGEMAQVMKELNLMTADGANLFFTEAGEMKSMSEVARLLTENLGHLTDEQKNQALSIMFGTRSINAAAGLMRYGATVTLTAAEAMEIFAVSQEEANAMIERGITEFDLLQAAMSNTSAAAAAAARMDNLAGSLEILQGVVETLRIRIGDVFNKDIRNAVNGLTQFLSANADRIVAIFASVRTFAVGILNVIKAFFGGLTGAMSGTLGKVEKNANSWGRNIVLQLARGMAAAATAVMRVINSIGIAITRLLKPGSPPRLLPEIDDWGTGTIDAWLSGFTAADFSVFDDLADTVERHLRNIAPAEDTTLIERILGSREVLADIIRQIRETGQIGADAFERLTAAAGPLPDHMRDYIQAMLDLEAVTAQVTQAQERLDAIRQLSAASSVADVQAMAAAYGGDLANKLNSYADALQNMQRANERVAQAQRELNDVTQKYDALLAPLNAQLRAISDRKQDMRDTERMGELEAIIADTRLSDSERQLAMMELEELQLRRQIRETEREKETAVDAAEAKLEAEQEAAEAAKKLAEEQQAAAMALAQAELDAAEAQQEAAQERMKVAQYMLEAQEKQNDLLKEQMNLLERLADSFDDLGGAISDALGMEGDSVLGDIEGALGGIGTGFDEAADDIETATDDMVSSIEQLVADIEAEFAPMNAAAEEAGTTWGGVANTISERWGRASSALIGDNLRLRGSYGELGNALIDLGLNIRNFAIRQLEKIGKWAEKNAPVFNQIGQALGWLASGFVRFITVVKVEMTKFWNVVEPILDGLVSMVLGAIEVIMNFFTGDWQTASDALEQIFYDAWEALKASWAALTEWVTAWFGTDWETVKQTWSDNWDMFVTILEGVWELLKEKLAEALTAVDEKINETITNWRDKWEEAKQNVSDKFTEIVANVFASLVDLVLKIFTKLDEIKANWDEKWAAIKTFVQTTWETIRTYVEEKVTAVKQKVEETIEALQVWWDEKWTAVQTFVQTTWDTISSYVEEKVTAVKTAVEEKIQALQEWWDERWEEISTTLSDTWDGIVKAATEKVEEVYTAVTDKIEEIQTWIEGKVNTFHDIGANLITSLKDGAISVADELISAVTGVVEDAIEAAKRLLGIASPSRVFTNMGKMSGQGFVKGIEAMRERMTRSMANVFGPALESAQSYASLLAGNQFPALAQATAAPAPAAATGATIEHYHFYGPVTVEGGKVAGDTLRELKRLGGRG